MRMDQESPETNDISDNTLASPLAIDKVPLTALVLKLVDGGMRRADAEEEAFDAFLRRAYNGKHIRVSDVFLPPLDMSECPMALALCVKVGDE